MPKQENQVGARKTKKKKRSHLPHVVETTIHIRRKVRNMVNHKKTPRAVKTVRRRARNLFDLPLVKIDTGLNKVLWANGIKRPPSRIRVKFQVKRLKGKGGQPCVIASHIPVASFHGLKTKIKKSHKAKPAKK